KYWYDALYRLTKATGRELSSLAIPSDTDFVNNIPVPNTASNAMQNYTQEYKYDELGNIEQMRSVGDWTRDYYYETANNRLKNHDNQTDVYSYDEHGNCTEMPHLPELIWDYKDELKEVTLNASNHKAYYVYDSSGERVRKVVDKGSVVEERLYIGGFEVYRKTVSGTLDYERETLKITEGRNTIAQLETKTVENGNTISTPTTNQRFQYSNHLGSACLELDSNAAIISYEEYHPFGTTSYRSGNSETEVSLKRYKYVGKERDEETGLYYYGARYYAAWIARFVSVDPIAEDYPYKTPYDYAENRPITGLDLDGFEWIHFEVRYTISEGEIIPLGDRHIIEDYRNENEETLNKMHGTSNFYEKYSQGFGPEGQGVLYTYKQVNESGKVINEYSKWDVKDGPMDFTRHGFYYGSGCITKLGRELTPREFGNYDFSISPLDMTDAIAREHDLIQNDNTGKSPWHIDYIYDDILLVEKLQTFLSLVENDSSYKDPFTGREPSKEAIKAAENAIGLFSIVIGEKMVAIGKEYDEGKITEEEYNTKMRLINTVFYAASKAPLPKPQNE
ncbi:MAG: hypothetical protein K9H64_20290, partial [Bacteroidales bacterium]|nr:hypothetical protein [Bacteroidales bacterium]MCF8458392.1 hypothetical protein [Bacteroidales bacterium]